jgi:HAE1 family hydrophobic/amphiphilic exporter-1
MRKEQNPEVSFGVVSVSTPYPGAGPDDVNELVSRPIEEAVSGVNGIREVTSISQEGISIVTIQLELGVNVDTAMNDARSKVDAIVNSLPEDVLKPTVLKFDNSSQPVITLAFSSDKLSSSALRDLMDKKIRDKFAQISGVASANVQGGDQREIQVQVDKDKLLAYNLGILDVQNAVAAGTVNAPAGRIVRGPQEYTVRVKNDYQTPEDVRNMIISVSDPTQFNGRPRSVRLSDIATVLDTVVDRTAYSRLDGHDTISLAISKSRDGNSVEIADKVHQALAQVKAEYADAGLKVVETYNEADMIQESLSDLQFSLFFGVFLVASIVFIFLHDWRGTLIVAIAIPTSIFATFIVMKLFGFTINNMSMLSLSLAIGVLVDDAIVVLENIYRHLKKGEDPRTAAINGRMEIGLAALAITFADVVVFLPIAFMGGIVGQFFKPLALGFVFATLFSLFVSFTITPLLASRWYKAGEDIEHPKGMFARAFERGFARLERGYRNGLEWGLNHRWFVFILGNAILLAVFMFIAGSFVPPKPPIGATGADANPMKFGYLGGLMAGQGLFMMSVVIGIIVTIVNIFRLRRFSLKYIASAALFGLLFPIGGLVGYQYAQWKRESVFKFEFLPTTDQGQVNATIELPPGSSLSETEAVVKHVEDVFQKDKAVKYVLSSLGTQGFGGFGGSSSGSNYAQVTATLYDRGAPLDRMPWKKHNEPLRWDRDSNGVAADLIYALGKVPGAKVNISAGSGFGFGSPVMLSFTSENREDLLATVEKVRDALASGVVQGVINPQISSKPGKPELRVVPDPRALADQGLTNSSVGAAIRTLYQGDNSTKLRTNGNQYDVRVILSPKDRNDPNVLSHVPVRFSQGNPIYLSQVAKTTTAPGVDKITRRDRAEEIQVTADILPGYANGTVNQQVGAYIKEHNLVPENVHQRVLGQADAQSREGVYMISALFLGLILVYMLLASLYNNILYPFIIQIAQPQALVGALLALMLTDNSFNLVGFIGVVTLVGLVGKNAILLVDYTNTLRDRGSSRHDALVEAGPTRLRPILMTTLALLLGMLPVALAIGRGSEFRETIGIVIIGGMIVSTILTLFVIPASYTIFDDLSLFLTRKRRARAAAGQASLPIDDSVNPLDEPAGRES